MAAMLGGREFDHVTATTKKEGRKKAAQVALALLAKEGCIKLADSSLTPDVRQCPSYALNLMYSSRNKQTNVNINNTRVIQDVCSQGQDAFNNHYGK